MQLLNKNVNVEKIEQELKTFIYENEFDVMLGANQCTSGIFVLLFSHRYNKQSSLVVTGTHDLEKVVKVIKKMVGGLS